MPSVEPAKVVLRHENTAMPRTEEHPVAMAMRHFSCTDGATAPRDHLPPEGRLSPFLLARKLPCQKPDLPGGPCA